ncbi:MAG: hypothetical protein IT380_16325 [Myxococcales bacterium]|nr:hypothetical protein [Myxococcales bacterium]
MELNEWRTASLPAALRPAVHALLQEPQVAGEEKSASQPVADRAAQSAKPAVHWGRRCRWRWRY